jgi:NAD+ synthase (glutamine-hydrolysing)
MGKEILRVGLSQLNLTVGDFSGNQSKISQAMAKAAKQKVDLLALPELAVTGYPPEDLLLKPSFIKDNLATLDKITAYSNNFPQLCTVIGFVDQKQDKLYNAAALIYRGKCLGVYHKILLPNYGVFDEKRYFTPGCQCPVFVIAGQPVGINICEDIWHSNGPCASQVIQGRARLIININASPYHYRKGNLRLDMLASRARDNQVTIAYCNLVGGQDELVFDGQSLIVNQEGEVLARGPQFKEALVVADLELTDKKEMPKRGSSSEHASYLVPRVVVSETCKVKENSIEPSKFTPLNHLEEVYQALVLGVHDYVKKNNFSTALVGLSGGIDSALTATIAVDALGEEHVKCVFMPSRYTSNRSREDALQLAKNLEVEWLEIPIEPVFTAYLEVLKPSFTGTTTDITEENLQARIRGNLLMALSNKFGWLLLSTGNKSETSVGYATLYGDMSGGFAVLKDVFKTLVYQLARHRNTISKVIPEPIFSKAPTAELKANQKDSDSLPAYELLDPILQAYVEEDKSLEEIVKQGYELETVSKVLKMVDRNEYKRRQAPPGVKITTRAFGKDRRMPITNWYNSARSS